MDRTRQLAVTCSLAAVIIVVAYVLWPRAPQVVVVIPPYTTVPGR